MNWTVMFIGLSVVWWVITEIILKKSMETMEKVKK